MIPLENSNLGFKVVGKLEKWKKRSQTDRHRAAERAAVRFKTHVRGFASVTGSGHWSRWNQNPGLLFNLTTHVLKRGQHFKICAIGLVF